MWASILAAISGVVQLALQLFNYFKKSPEEKERERLGEAIEKKQEQARVVNEAIKRARRGRTSRIERIINRRK